MATNPETPAEAWTTLVEELRRAGENLATATRNLDPMEQADAFRALVRGLNNQLGRFEVDRDRPELVEFNGWREKMFMDNPDFRYWVADINDAGSYRITGVRGCAAYMSITVYSSSGTLDAAAAARLDSDSISFADDGSFAVTVSPSRDGVDGDWIELATGASAVWVRQFHHDAAVDALGWCRIESLEATPPPAPIEPGRFTHQLTRLAKGIGAFPSIVEHAAKADLAHVNEIRHWSEMAGGAAFTEPNIHYLRGAWQLGPDEALVVEGAPPDCRYWNMLLYSRFLNSLDYRNRTVSLTNATATLSDGNYRFVLAARDPGGEGDWLDTEGRPFGIFVLRFLQPTTQPALPTVRVVPIAELADER